MMKWSSHKVNRVLELRQEAQRARAKATEATRKFCLALTEKGISTRKIGAMIGISGTAVHQYLQSQ